MALFTQIVDDSSLYALCASWVHPVCMAMASILFLRENYCRKVFRTHPMIQVEKSGFCQSVLRARKADGYFPPTARIADDVCSYTPTGNEKLATVVAAGFPCQARFMCFLPLL